MTQDDRRDRNEPVSLAPLTPEEALRALLAVKPDDEPASDRSSPTASEDEKVPPAE